ncbi:4-(cytidine 5'-diphospho)-2-C-methyl-D-erythritol kinase [Parvularcula sp. ZS-1/3]|uniref:4-diphosphocytidyl-2-C-methyl-D-erythritol kinase n=1 Tax=Parvularcula mediterranea TaxID=2732508 RepID=A0A7Y3RJ43_9PROT|nr:4-(cytidine 5'-diphospho)-2-C-methyl-D-erythritol kinase [Parvularcula mediterranea]
MTEAVIFAPVKINLALHVGPPRADGYHPVDTLCVFPMLGDVLAYDPEGPPGIDFTGTFGEELAGEGHADNLIWRAFLLLDLEPQGRFLLQKETPIASGIGAGTADGVAAMLLLNDVHELGFDADQLRRRSLGLGADGPVCMAGQINGGGVIRASGIGERITLTERCEPEAIVLANPGYAVSTGEVFRRFDAGDPSPLTPAAYERTGGAAGMVHRNRNDLLAPAEEIEPAIEPLIATMSAQPGARAASMSGSGATCFAIHASATSAERAARDLRAQGFWAESSFILPGNA